MSKYGYNENEHVKIIAEAIDKDGFHKKVEVEDGDSSSGGELEENVYFINKPLTEAPLDTTGPFVVICNKNDFQDNFYSYGRFGTLYLYFGDAIDDADLHVVEDDTSAYISDNDVTNYGLVSRNFGYGHADLTDDYVAIDINVLTSDLPNNWENLQAHAIITYSCNDGLPESHDELHILQIHQK